MNVRGFFHAAGLEREAKGPLQRRARHRLEGAGRALAAVAFGREEPLRMAMALPLLSQQMERALGQWNITVAIAFTSADVQEHAPGINVADLQPQSFAQTQAAGINGAQAEAMIQGADMGENSAHFACRKNHGQFELGIGADQFQFVGPIAFECFLPEEFDRANGLGAGLPSDLLYGLEMNAILADFLRRDQVWRFVVELAELAHASVISFLGARPDGQELEVINEGF